MAYIYTSPIAHGIRSLYYPTVVITVLIVSWIPSLHPSTTLHFPHMDLSNPQDLHNNNWGRLHNHNDRFPATFTSIMVINHPNLFIFHEFNRLHHEFRCPHLPHPPPKLALPNPSNRKQIKKLRTPMPRLNSSSIPTISPFSAPLLIANLVLLPHHEMAVALRLKMQF